MFTNYHCLENVFTQKDLNLTQQRWMRSFNDFYVAIQYHLGKTNAVADALSQKLICMGNLAYKSLTKRPFAKEI